MSVVFDHPLVGPLKIRLNPTSVRWDYNMSVSTEDTYGGQVIQFLGVNIGRLTIEGQLGREGPHGRVRDGMGHLLEKEFWWEVDNVNPYGNGLAEIFEWFVRYFAVATQGGDDIVSGSFSQDPVKLTYAGAGVPRRWDVFPVSFPSFKRSNEDFAPEWQVICEVEEADKELEISTSLAAIKRLRDTTGTVDPKYSGPEEDANIVEDFITIVDEFRDLLPAYTVDQLEELMFFNASLPYYFSEVAHAAAEAAIAEQQGGGGAAGGPPATTP